MAELIAHAHDLIVGRCNEEAIRALAVEMIELGEANGNSPREWLAAASIAMGLMIGGSFSREMHDGCLAACLDAAAAWAQEGSK
jgi:hypothetical protein